MLARKKRDVSILKEQTAGKSLNNLYNFKNPIRHFFNIDAMCFDGVGEVKYDCLCWTKPIPFKIYKTEDSERTIKFPNILNFYHTIETFEQDDFFYKINKMSNKKRVSPDLTTGEFSVLSYDKSIQFDYFCLVKYDKLLMLDIKSFYGRVYLHDFNFSKEDNKEQRVGSLNSGRSNGLLLGNYLSLYLAEMYLKKIEDDLNKEISKASIDCEYQYFSDDFYFFCYNKDIDKLKHIFSKVLDKYDLQINNEKTELIDFDKYSKTNSLDKLWKKIINISKEKYKDNASNNHPSFFTQLNYRLSQIEEIKYKRIFLVNFFKTKYFYNLNAKKFQLSESDFNYLCYIYKLMPECMIYSIDKVKKMNNFDEFKFGEFLESRFKSVLDGNRYEEQLYYYYAIKICKKDEVLCRYKKEIMETQNQLLISYCLMDGIILENDYHMDRSEDKWFQNYHYLLKYSKYEIDVLLPENAKRDKQISTYRKFYQNNIDKKIPILCTLDKVKEHIANYLKSRIKSYELLEEKTKTENMF